MGARRDKRKAEKANKKAEKNQAKEIEKANKAIMKQQRRESRNKAISESFGAIGNAVSSIFGGGSAPVSNGNQVTERKGFFSWLADLFK